MPRQTILASLNVQFDNPVQPPQWGAPVLLATASVVTDASGKALYQPTYQQQPAVAEDFTPEILALLNEKLDQMGLVISFKEAVK